MCPLFCLVQIELRTAPYHILLMEKIALQHFKKIQDVRLIIYEKDAIIRKFDVVFTWYEASFCLN